MIYTIFGRNCDQCELNIKQGTINLVLTFLEGNLCLLLSSHNKHPYPATTTDVKNIVRSTKLQPVFFSNRYYHGIVNFLIKTALAAITGYQFAANSLSAMKNGSMLTNIFSFRRIGQY